MDPENYCREIEAYLCRKNDGHLVRVVGPAFGMVTGWAVQGIPFKVACRGIDRYFERYYSKGPRRRPVRVEFCEADVLDVFEEWRRAVGIGMAPSGSSETRGDSSAPAGGSSTPTNEGSAPTHSLRAHIDRAVTRLTDLQARGGLPGPLEEAVERLIDRLAADREASRTLRGQARETYLQALKQLDIELLETARQVTPDEAMAGLRRDAEDVLSDYRTRMPADAYERALAAAADKLLGEYWKLPMIRY